MTSNKTQTKFLPKVGQKYRHKEILEVSSFEQSEERTKVYFTKGTWMYTHEMTFIFEELPEEPTNEAKDHSAEVQEAKEGLRELIKYQEDYSKFDFVKRSQSLINALEEQKELEDRNKKESAIAEDEIAYEEQEEELKPLSKEEYEKKYYSKDYLTTEKSEESNFIKEKPVAKDSFASDIWKDISELPKLDIDNDFISIKAYARFKDGEIRNAYITNLGIFTEPNELVRRREDLVEFCTLTDYINNNGSRLKKLEETIEGK